MEFIPLVVLGLLVVKLVDLFKGTLASFGVKLNGQATFVVAWVASVLSLLLFGASRWAGDIPIGNDPLSALSFNDVLLAAFAVAATGAVVGHDAVKALGRGRHQSETLVE